MSSLVLRAQQLADMEGDLSIGSDVGGEWYALISEAYGEAYEIVAGEGNRYFEFTTTWVTDGTNTMPEPPDQLSIVDQLELIIDATTGKCRRLRPITAQQRAAMSGRTGVPVAYELVDDTYRLYPTPPAGKSITLRYIGQCPDLTTFGASGAVDCYCVAGQKFVQYAAAAAARGKSGSDTSALIAEREVQRKALWEWASERAANAQPVWYVEDEDNDDLPANWSW